MGKDDKEPKRQQRNIPSGHQYEGIAAKKDYVQAEGGSSRYKPQDPSTCMRVIKGGPDGQEFIISGPREVTFAQACKANWPFKSVPQKSGWFIRDAQDNDVTNASLETVDGIFILVPEYGKEVQKEETDESDEYSSIHDSVTYYD
jgi:hypothetical protein